MTVDGDGCTMRGGWWGDGEWGHEGLMKHERERERKWWHNPRATSCCATIACGLDVCETGRQEPGWGDESDIGDTLLHFLGVENCDIGKM